MATRRRGRQMAELLRAYLLAYYLTLWVILWAQVAIDAWYS